MRGAPPETNRSREREPPGMPWAQRHFSAAQSRAILGGNALGSLIKNCVVYFNDITI